MGIIQSHRCSLLSAVYSNGRELGDTEKAIVAVYEEKMMNFGLLINHIQQQMHEVNGFKSKLGDFSKYQKIENNLLVFQKILDKLVQS